MSTSSPRQDGLWRAAVLVDSLDRAGADRILDQMDPYQAQAIRQAMVDLGPVDPQTRQKILEEFFGVGSAAPRSASPGVELDSRLAQRLAQGEDATDAPLASKSWSFAGTPFAFLHNAEDERVARALADERPQTIALVLSHLPHQQAGRVLVHLAPNTQTEVLRRLAHLEEIDPEVLCEVEQAVQARFSRLAPLRALRAAGHSAVASIVRAAGGRLAEPTVDALRVHPQPMTGTVGTEPVQFDDLARLDATALAEVVQQSDPEIILLALVGAESELLERILSLLPQPEAICIRHRLENLGPTRLSDVEEARRQMADLARHLAAIGAIRLPTERSGRRVPLAA